MANPRNRLPDAGPEPQRSESRDSLARITLLPIEPAPEGAAPPGLPDAPSTTAGAVQAAGAGGAAGPLGAGAVGFFDVDATTLRLRGDDTFAALHGLDAAAATAGLPAPDAFRHVHPADRAAVVASVPAVMASRGYTKEYRVEGLGGTRWVMACGRRQPGPPVRFTGVVIDVSSTRAAEAVLRDAEALQLATLERQVLERTAALEAANARLRTEARERERTEAILRQRQKMEAIGQLTGGIAHDFNNMLQGIGGGLELMQRRLAQGRPQDAVPFVAQAQRAVERAAALTHRLLSFARRQSLNPVAVDVDALAGGLHELLGNTVGPRVRIVLARHDGSWPVLCDANQLESVLLSLCLNARDALPGGGDVTIATRHVTLGEAEVAGQEGAEAGEFVEITVTDAGAGMSPAVQARAFEPFFTTKPFGEGTGLGLSQVYGFVRQSGGVLDLHSTEGEGTVVRICLPRHLAAAGPEEPAPASPARPTADERPVVLLVEDEALLREMTAESLGDQGYRVLEAADAEAALDALAQGARPAVMVTDVGLPNGANGRQLADAARAVQPGLPVLFITGYEGGVLDGQLEPGMAVLCKPFRLEVLGEYVAALIRAQEPVAGTP
ncbi:MAG: ATP-binding protein [Janthinobacterium lividum]